MDVVILAAGRGTRMGDLETPKCLIDLGGTKIIDHQINCFREIGVENIFVVTGHNSEMISNHLDNKVTLIENPEYSNTNNLYSLWVAKKILKNDFICVYSDLFFHKKILQNCVNSKDEVCLVIEKNIRDETMRVKIEGDYVIEINKIIPMNSASGNFIGLAKFKKESIDSLFSEISKLISQHSLNAYYTSAIESMIKKGKKIGFVETDNLPWMDIDEKHEIQEARKIYEKINEEGS
jgi:choline kinase